MLKNLMVLVSGSTGAQIIAFLALPLITKTYSPDSFGDFAFFSSIIWAFVVVGTFQFEHLIINVKSEKECLNCILSIIQLSALLVAAFVIAIVLYESKFDQRIDLKLYGLLSFTFLVICCNQLLRSYLVKLSLFKEVTYSNIMFTLLNVSFVLSFPSFLIFDNSHITLLAAQLLAYSAALFYILSRINFSDLSYRFSLDLLHARMLEAFTLVKSNFTKTFNSRFVIVIIEKYFDEQTVGFYAMSERLISAPLTIIGQSVNLVNRPKFEQLINNQNFGDLKIAFYKTLGINLSIGLPIATLVSLFSKDIVSIFFSAEWTNISDIISLIIFFELFNFILLTVEDVPIFLNKNRQKFLSHLLFFTTLVAMYWIGTYSLTNIFITLAAVKILMIVIDVWIFEVGIRKYA